MTNPDPAPDEILASLASFKQRARELAPIVYYPSGPRPTTMTTPDPTPAHFPALVAMSTPLAQARHGHPFGASAETVRVAVVDCARLLGASDAAKEVSRRLHGPAHGSYLAYRAAVVASAALR